MSLLRDLTPRLLPFEKMVETHAPKEGGSPTNFQSQAWTLVRVIQAKRREVSEHLFKAACIEGEMRALAALHDSLPTCAGCRGSGKICVSNDDHGVDTKTCNVCEGTGRDF